MVAIFLPMLMVGTRVLAYANPGIATGLVNDFAGILSPSDKQALEAKLESFQKSTGDEIAVVTIANLGGDTIENFAVQLFKDWGIGEKGKDNGVLLLVARDDKQIRIEVGYGLEGALTDAQSYLLIQNQVLPAFKTGDYVGGINAGVDKIMAAVQGEVLPSADQNDNPNLADKIFSFSWFGFLILMWIASALARSKSWWAGGVVGGVMGVIIGFIFGFIYWGLLGIILLIPLGLLFDFIVSRAYSRSKLMGVNPPWWIGGGGFGSGGGGFGGFGGGSSGGGGASGSW